MLVFLPDQSYCSPTSFSPDCTPGRQGQPGLHQIEGVRNLQEYVLPRIAGLVRVVRHVLDHELLLHRFQKMHVGSPSTLEAEVADGLWTYEILESLLEQWECRLEIHAIRSQYDIWMLWDGLWRRCAPFVHSGLHPLAEVVQLNVLLHQSEHRVHIGDMNRSTGLTSHGHSQPIAVNTRVLVRRRKCRSVVPLTQLVHLRHPAQH